MANRIGHIARQIEIEKYQREKLIDQVVHLEDELLF
jgi:hypothetical protein